MSYVQRNLIPLTLGLLAVVAIIIGIGTVAVRLTADQELTDVQFEQELERRIERVMRGGNPTLAVQMDANLRVTEVLPEGPGAVAGMKAGDQVLAINDQDVATIDQARTRLAAVPRGAEFTVTVNREGARVNLKAQKTAAVADFGGMFQRLTERMPQFGGSTPTPTPTARPPLPAAPTTGPTLGVSLQAVSGGLQVQRVMPNGAAAAAGVAIDDVIVSANNRATPTVEALQAILQSAGAGGVVSLNLRRADQQITVTAQLGPRS